MPGFSLWMLPPADVGDRFRSLIADLSRRTGTPAFEPHLTLAGGIDAATERAAAARVAPLAARLPPLPIRLTEVGTTGEYYRCLFIHAERTPLLQRAHHEACAVLAQEPGDFMPHLSLIYGEIGAADKARIITDIGTRFDLAFTVERLALYSTAGPPPAWRRVAALALTGT